MSKTDTIDVRELERLIGEGETKGPWPAYEANIGAILARHAKAICAALSELERTKAYADGRDHCEVENAELRAELARLKQEMEDTPTAQRMLDERDAEIERLKARIAEQQRYLLADEERRKLTGDALAAEAERDAAVERAEDWQRVANLRSAEIARLDGELRAAVERESWAKQRLTQYQDIAEGRITGEKPSTPKRTSKLWLEAERRGADKALEAAAKVCQAKVNDPYTHETDGDVVADRLMDEIRAIDLDALLQEK